jgi:quercetin dioxygenase-like cupin family protein
MADEPAGILVSLNWPDVRRFDMDPCTREQSDPHGSTSIGGLVPTALPVRVAELVQYQSGSIVSRTIAQNKAGTMTIFAFTKGQALSEHCAPYDAFVQVLEGVTELRIGGKLIVASAGETVLMPAEVPHAVSACENFKMLLTMIRGKPDGV